MLVICQSLGIDHIHHRGYKVHNNVAHFVWNIADSSWMALLLCYWRSEKWKGSFITSLDVISNSILCCEHFGLFLYKMLWDHVSSIQTDCCKKLNQEEFTKGSHLNGLRFGCFLILHYILLIFFQIFCYRYAHIFIFWWKLLDFVKKKINGFL